MPLKPVRRGASWVRVDVRPMWSLTAELGSSSLLTRWGGGAPGALVQSGGFGGPSTLLARMCVEPQILPCCLAAVEQILCASSLSCWQPFPALWVWGGFILCCCICLTSSHFQVWPLCLEKSGPFEAKRKLRELPILLPLGLEVPASLGYLLSSISSLFCLSCN